MRAYVFTSLLVFTLLLSGCASSSAPTARKPREPLPGPVTFTGDYDRAPTPRFMPRTVFPPFLIERGQSGSATIVFKVKADGYVEEARVESATEPAFGASALGTVGRMVFRPASKAGSPVAAVGRVTFPFEFE